MYWSFLKDCSLKKYNIHEKLGCFPWLVYIVVEGVKTAQNYTRTAAHQTMLVRWVFYLIY